jgi:hypothetical protein
VVLAVAACLQASFWLTDLWHPSYYLLGHWQQELPHLITHDQVVVVDDHGLLPHNMHSLAHTQRMLASRQQLLLLLLLLRRQRQLTLVCRASLTASMQAI